MGLEPPPPGPPAWGPWTAPPPPAAPPRPRSVLAVVAAIALGLGLAVGAGVVIATHLRSGSDCRHASFFSSDGNVAAGDAGCGVHVGASIALQDCLSGQPTTAFGVRTIDEQGDFSPVGTPAISGPGGCIFRSSATSGSGLFSTLPFDAPLIALADFVPRNGTGAAVLLAWEARPPVAITLHPHGSASLEYVLAGASTTFTQGTNDVVPLIVGHTYRLILRVASGRVDTWLNGVALASWSLTPTAGGTVAFFVGNGDSTVDVHRLEVLAAG